MGSGAAITRGAAIGAWATGGPSLRMRNRMSPASNSNSWKGSRPTNAMRALISSRPMVWTDVLVATGAAWAAARGAGVFFWAADGLREVLIRAPTVRSDWG